MSMEMILLFLLFLLFLPLGYAVGQLFADE